jgi:hypothetical protein
VISALSLSPRSGRHVDCEYYVAPLGLKNLGDTSLSTPSRDVATTCRPNGLKMKNYYAMTLLFFGMLENTSLLEYFMAKQSRQPVTNCHRLKLTVVEE